MRDVFDGNGEYPGCAFVPEDGEELRIVRMEGLLQCMEGISYVGAAFFEGLGGDGAVKK